MSAIPPPPEDRLGAFVPGLDCRRPPTGDGPLAGLTLAVKDLFDIEGAPTAGSTPDWPSARAPAKSDAWAVAALRAAGAAVIGKTITDEVSRGLMGENRHYGIPVNPRAPGRVPGGSSSGSAAAVAGGLADIALGTDTGGSLRVPASFCGLYGMRPSVGAIPMDGVIPQSPLFDTVGWFARDAATFARVGEVLLRRPPAAHPPARLLIAEDAFAFADGAVAAALRAPLERIAAAIGRVERIDVAPEGLGPLFANHGTLQAREAYDTFAPWLDAENPRLAWEVAAGFAGGAAIARDRRGPAMERRRRHAARLATLCGADGVIAIPTTPFPAPPRDLPRRLMWPLRTRAGTLTCIAGSAQAPQVSLPLAEVDGLPVGLSLIAAPGNDALLLRAALAFG
ncbi:amidase [Elioraea tepidiphila]|jgi:amidase|uniref:amidase n=1 Tax=Elioraea tepidiphila TaxID=457934 RepID=UPI000382A66D|nr:amidase [Elioraea tepidiphila]